MHKKKKYGELTFYLEACEAGSMFDEHMLESLKIYAMTASNANESSWSCYCATEILPGACLGDFFSENLLKETLAEQFEIVRNKTDRSHVQSIGSLNITYEHVSEFMGSKEPNEMGENMMSKSNPKDYPMYPQTDIPLFLLAQKLKSNGDDILASNALQTLKKKRRYLEKQITQLVNKLVRKPADQLQIMNIYPQSITDKECHHRVVHAFNKFCFNFSEVIFEGKFPNKLNFTENMLMFWQICVKGELRYVTLKPL
ncbi:unnamed protein product [Meloidogyne enterolobii]|uniref:Uncharacterized protein n=1 Tax=Meloidogyne enterolobii TaxID=390850 RepID=A0ACB0ZJX3_MELEN